MTELDAALRESILWSLRVLGELDGVEGRDRIVAFDNATVALDAVMDLEDADEMVGEVLRNEQEARALNGVRTAFRCMYDLHGGQATNAQVVNHPYFMSIVCTAAYAAEVLEREDRSVFCVLTVDSATTADALKADRPDCENSAV